MMSVVQLIHAKVSTVTKSEARCDAQCRSKYSSHCTVASSTAEFTLKGLSEQCGLSLVLLVAFEVGCVHGEIEKTMAVPASSSCYTTL